jgi:type I pantothenate kinase
MAIGPLEVADLAALLAGRIQPGSTLLVGVTGSVAAGKSTLVAALAAALASAHRTEIVATDGFLRANADLDAGGLTLRKGYPESYDAAAMVAVLRQLRSGSAVVPGYSHVIYDVDPALARSVGPVDVVLVEGLGLAAAAAAFDVLVYLDAAEADLEDWFTQRFMGLWHAAADEPSSFYAGFRGLSEADAEVLARSVWTNINLPNLREHILPVRDLADIVVEKAADHSLRRLR